MALTAGIVGLPNVGKSTLFKLANDLLTITSGEILIEGKPISVESKKIISYLPERLHYRILSPEPAELLLALSSPHTGFFFFGNVKAMPVIHYTHGPAPAQLVSIWARLKLTLKVHCI